jgi:alkylation response protein AidB-like acyl-CoA dehydrogenase
MIERTVFTPGMPGFEKGKRLKKLGLKAEDTSELFFDQVRVPAGNLLGGAAMEGKGIVCLMQGRLDTAAASMAKLWCSDLQCKVMDERLQLFGGCGFMWE